MEVTPTNLAEKHEDDEPNVSAALLAGAEMATKYISKALFGDFALLGVGTVFIPQKNWPLLLYQSYILPSDCPSFKARNGTQVSRSARRSCSSLSRNTQKLITTQPLPTLLPSVRPQ
jgi:hypothetical protein